jgi:muconolactone delta-isomerase
MDPAGDIQKVASMRRGDSGSLWRRGDSGSLWRRGDDVFSRSSRDEDDEEALRWAALERLPTNDRVRRAIVPLGLAGGDDEAAPAGGGKGVVDVDVLSLGPRERRALLERLVRVADEDNERFLLKLKDRIDR